MKNPNNHNVDSTAHLRRTTYDLSHSKHMSGKIGELLPVMFQEVNAGEVFHWSPNFNFRFAPTAMPIQTRIKCVVDYFFVPMEAIWKDQTAFFNQGMNNTVQPPSHPWLKLGKNSKNIGVGTVGDYLGIPSAINAEKISWRTEYNFNAEPNSSFVVSHCELSTKYLRDHPTSSITRSSLLNSPDSDIFLIDKNPSPDSVSSTFSRNSVKCLVFSTRLGGYNRKGISKNNKVDVFSNPLDGSLSFPFFDDLCDNGFTFCEANMKRLNTVENLFITFGVCSSHSDYHSYDLRLTNLCHITEIGSSSESVGLYSNEWNMRFTPADITRLKSWHNSLSSEEKDKVVMVLSEIHHYGSPVNSDYLIAPRLEGHVVSISKRGTAMRNPNILEVKDGEAINYSLSRSVDRQYPVYLKYKFKDRSLVTDSAASLPFVGNNPQIPLSPFGHRSYEICYNFFYRNKDIDPLVDALGHRIVNQFLPDSMRTSGADSNEYPIRHALLEKDIFTSCFTEPLVNYNPLIGIRQKNNDVFYDFATSGGVVSMSAGQSGVGVTETGVNVNQYTGAMITSYGEGIPQGDLNVFKDIIATGITNQDIYSAQCMQRWISNKVQKGYNFSEQQLAQFGVNSRWNPLTAPSYLGGTAEWINNGVVCNTAQSEDHALGELGGMPSCISNKEHSFSYKAHDRGFVIGIMRIVPIPIYSQAIHKVFTKQKYTDYFIPEFDNKGYEAVPKGELVPYLASAENKEKEAFGYQVPWYDYKSAYDTISGDMRTSFNDSVIMRDFGTLPELSRQFIECHADDYNNVFVQTKQSDKFIGEIFHNIKAERVIGDYQSRVFANVH